MNVSNFGDAFKNSSKSLLFGPGTTQFRWDLKQTLSLQLTIGATAVACPWIIFLKHFGDLSNQESKRATEKLQYSDY